MALDVSHLTDFCKHFPLPLAASSAAASGRPGPLTDWVTADCDRRCPSLFLASWGYQCALGRTHCCLRKNSICTPWASYKSEPKPATWRGRDLTNTGNAPPTCGAPPPPGSLPPAAKCQGGGKWHNASASQYWSFPPCCEFVTADQTECVVYSGCQYVVSGAGRWELGWARGWLVQVGGGLPGGQSIAGTCMRLHLGMPYSYISLRTG